jgi:hypothetical protein
MEVTSLFNVTTFTVNQINSNSIALVTNGVQVPSSALAITEVVAPVIGTHNTNFFVRFTGPLAAGIIYSNVIIVRDNSGQGTTNTFLFDTFSTNGALIVEAEDYNFGNGQFQDNPPVSGLDPTGAQINGGGSGYYGNTGAPDVDFSDTDSTPDTDESQYRLTDGVGTTQNLFAGDTPRPDHVAAGVPDYTIWRMLAGEWLNYTRTFPAGRWNVYLRTSSQAREDVRFDQVTGDRTQPNQTKVLKGMFLVPNTGSSSRFRYVPLTDAAGNQLVLDFTSTATSPSNTFRMTALGGLVRGGDSDSGSFQPTVLSCSCRLPAQLRKRPGLPLPHLRQTRPMFPFSRRSN